MKITKEQLNDYLYSCEFHKKLNSKTIKAYRLDLKQFHLYSYNTDICKPFILSYISYIQSLYKPRTVKRKVASLKALFSYFAENEIMSNPFHDIKLKIKQPLILPRTIPLDTLQNLFTTIYDASRNECLTDYKFLLHSRDIAIIELLFGTGIRISELCSLTTDSVNLLSGSIKIYGKGGKERIIQIPNASIINALVLYNNIRPKKLNNYFFTNRCNSRLSEQSVRFMLKKYTKLCNIELNITPHMFRHTFATMLLDDDVDIRYIQQILGHSSIITTQIYTHVSQSKQRDILLTKNPRNKLF